MKKQIVMLLASSLMAGAVVAQTKDDSAFYVGVDAGYAALAVSNYSKASLPRLFGGYQFSQNVALELGYFNPPDFKREDGYEDSRGKSRGNTRLKIKGFDLAAIYKFTEFVPGLFLKAGITRGTADKSEEGSGVRDSASFTYSKYGSQSGIGYLAGLGYELNLTGGLDARLAYTRHERIAAVHDGKLNVFSLALKYRF
jgi:hypothetical protein